MKAVQLNCGAWLPLLDRERLAAGKHAASRFALQSTILNQPVGEYKLLASQRVPKTLFPGAVWEKACTAIRRIAHFSSQVIVHEQLTTNCEIS
jgi:hypothetical protein